MTSRFNPDDGCDCPTHVKLREAKAAIQRVRDKHQPDYAGVCTYGHAAGGQGMRGVDWPCDVIKDLEGS